MAFRLAVLSDPHLPPPAPPAARALVSKRALGWANWRRGRHRVHRPETLERVVADIAAHRPDHVLVAGDLTNLALDEEIAAARAWLDALGDPADVTVIPGNHDAYVPGALERACAAWAPFMASDAGEPRFPIVRRRGPLLLVGLSSAVPSAPFRATGRVGSRQIAALERTDTHDGCVRIVAVHHPVAMLGHAHKRLLDGAAVASCLARAGADLVVHGHMHRPMREILAGGVPQIGVPSASSAHGTTAHPAGWLLIEIDARELRVTRRAHVAADRIADTEHERIARHGHPARG